MGLGAEIATGDLWKGVDGFLGCRDEISSFQSTAEIRAFMARVTTELFLALPAAGGGEVAPKTVLGRLETEEFALFKKSSLVAGQIFAKWTAVIGEPEGFGDPEGSPSGKFESRIVGMIRQNLIRGAVTEWVYGTSGDDAKTSPARATEVLKTEASAHL